MVNEEGSLQCLMQIFTTWKRKLSPFFGCCGFLYSLSKPGWTGDHYFCEVGDWASIIKWPTSRLDRLQDWTETELHLQSIITDNAHLPNNLISGVLQAPLKTWVQKSVKSDWCATQFMMAVACTGGQWQVIQKHKRAFKVFAHSTDYVYTLMIYI